MHRLVRFVRSRIAVKLTLTLVGFVAASTLVAGLYFRGALDRFAVESLEARLTIAGRLLHDEARARLARNEGPEELSGFVRRAARPTESRVTLIAPDGRALADSDAAPTDLGRLDDPRERPEVRAALAGRVGRDQRASGPVRLPLVYVALPVTDGSGVIGVLRLSRRPTGISTA
jgi:hypothetical protein